MKKKYISPEIVTSLEILVEMPLNESPTYQMNGGVDESGKKVLQGGNVTSSGEEDEAGARQRGGDFGSLW